MVYQWLQVAAHQLLPGRCILCRAATGRALDLCSPCEADLLRPRPACRHCGLATPVDAPSCGACAARPFAFARCVPLGCYSAPLDGLIRRFKVQRQPAVGRVLTQLLVPRLRQHYGAETMPAALLPVPLHWQRQWRRGFNQSYLLARDLSGPLGIPLDAACLRRSRPTPSQQGLDRRRRQANLRGAFELTAPPPAPHLALVDDVVTTGATADSIARLLLAAGVERVDLWCLARTPPTA